MNLNDLYTFATVAKHGTLTAAAKKLSVPKSTVSRRLTRLEDDLGVELFSRSARKIVLTQDGQAFFKRIVGSLDEIVEAQRIIQEQSVEPEGVLRITTTEGYGQTPAFLSCLSTYIEQYPKVTIDLVLTSRVTNLVEDKIDVGFRLYTGQLPGDASTMSRRLHSVTSGLYTSPDYIERCGDIQTNHDLARHRYIAFGRRAFAAHPWLYDGVISPNVPDFSPPSLLVNNTATLTHCALVGMGVCILDRIAAERFVDTGQLVHVLPRWSQEIAKVSLVWIASRHLSVKTRSFINHAVACLKSPS